MTTMAGRIFCQVNGAMLDNIELYHSEVHVPRTQFDVPQRWQWPIRQISESLGPDFMRPIVGRGLAAADYDNDGDIDFAIDNRGNFPELLRNDGGNANHWLEVLLVGTRSNRDAIGSILNLVSEGFVQVEQAQGGIGFMSSSDPRIHFGLGRRSKIESLVITWPSGQVDRLTNVAGRSDYCDQRRHGNCAAHQFPEGFLSDEPVLGGFSRI